MKPGALHSFIHIAMALLVAVCAVGGFLGLRAFVWRQAYLIPTMLQTGFVVGVVGAVGFLALYFLFGGLLGRLLSIDWFSLQAGALLGALLYGGYNAIAPLSIYSVNETPGWRALQGGVDGLWIGALIGLATLFISARHLHPDRPGLTRFVLLYVTVILMVWLVLLAQGVLHLPDVVGLVVALPLMAILRLVVAGLDRRADRHHYHDYGYDDGG